MQMDSRTGSPSVATPPLIGSGERGGADDAPEVRFDIQSPYGRVPTAAATTTAGALRGQLAGERFDSAAHVAVLDDDRRLVGLVRIEEVLAAEPDRVVGDVMDADPPVVRHGVGEEQAAWKAVRHGESALAVVDDDGRFVGLIPPRRMVEVLLAEHDEDLARLGGYLASTSSARHATEESVGIRFAHRLPWLLIGLAGAAASARLMGAFEAQLQRDVLIAFFVPGIVYMAAAAGIQTEMIVIRGLSVGVPIGRVVRRELATGLLVGLALALAFLPVGMLAWGRDDIVAAVALALLAACCMATIVAMLLPWLLFRLGRDPAFGAGPVATLIQDMLSLLIYFGIVELLVH